jgi:thermostable 8-oxoguanine DNA glycosylase
MLQTVYALRRGKVVIFKLPDPREEVMPGIRWGLHVEYFTPAYWAAQAKDFKADKDENRYRLGETLKEEVAACLLGGYGIPAEVGLSAYYRLKEWGLLENGKCTNGSLSQALRIPLKIGDRTIRYRFWKQKASYLAPLIAALEKSCPDETDHQKFRNWFLNFRGIGLKTASWITRNWLASDQVAILDIHVVRAGILCGLFPRDCRLERDYLSLEKVFLDFAKHLNVSPAKLDAVIWQQMREAGTSIIQMVREIKFTDRSHRESTYKSLTHSQTF